MKELRRKYHRFLNRNRNKGIPNLMLYIGIGNIIIYFLSTFGNGSALGSLLYFDADLICHGQIWRFFTFLFTYGVGDTGNPMTLFSLLLSTYFYYFLGQVLESAWGTLRSNIYYFTGIFATALVGLILYFFGIPMTVTAYYVNLSLFLAAATIIPEERVYLFFFIPVKMRWMALIDIGLILYELFQFFVIYTPQFGANTGILFVIIFGAAIISLLNYGFSFGRQMRNLLPNSMQSIKRQKRRIEFRQASGANPNWANKYRNEAGQRPYHHKCTVCGRTDTDCPDLEFRYCSRCNGYFCYCIDHINNHTHVQ